jgi:hypothetical protein
MISRFSDVSSADLEKLVQLIAWINANAVADRNTTRTRTDEGAVIAFWSRVHVCGPLACWPWKRGSQKEYGVFWHRRVKHKAHRFAAELFYGPAPEGSLACHRCDNKQCCNPSHLYFGSAKDNVRDCKIAGRLVREMGAQRYNAKLTSAAVAEIKAGAPTRRYGWGRMMARKFGVGPTAINNVIRGRRWKHIGPSHAL